MGAFIGQLIDGRERWLNGKSAVAGTFWCGLNLIALIVFGRWLAGAFSGEPSAGVLCAAATVIAVSGLGSYAVFQQLDFRGEHWLWGALPAFLTLFPSMVLLVVIPGSAATAWWFAATLLCLTVAAVFTLETAVRHRQHLALAIQETEPAPLPNESPGDTDIDVQLEQRLAGTLSAVGLDQVEHPWQALGVTQWMTRSDANDGSVSVEGVTVADFAAGQNRASVHVTFCPPLPDSPQVECEAVDGTDVRIKVAAVFPHGARIDLTRPAHDKQPIQVALGYFAHVERKKTAEAAA